MKTNDLVPEISCENCIRIAEFPELCGNGRRCGIMAGRKLILPFTTYEDYNNFKTGVVTKQK